MQKSAINAALFYILLYDLSVIYVLTVRAYNLYFYVNGFLTVLYVLLSCLLHVNRLLLSLGRLLLYYYRLYGLLRCGSRRRRCRGGNNYRIVIILALGYEDYYE